MLDSDLKAQLPLPRYDSRSDARHCLTQAVYTRVAERTAVT